MRLPILPYQIWYDVATRPPLPPPSMTSTLAMSGAIRPTNSPMTVFWEFLHWHISLRVTWWRTKCANDAIALAERRFKEDLHGRGNPGPPYSPRVRMLLLPAL